MPLRLALSVPSGAFLFANGSLVSAIEVRAQFGRDVSDGGAKEDQHQVPQVHDKSLGAHSPTPSL